MAKPYALEIARLRRTVDWATSTDSSELKDAVESSSTRPIVAIGSGGSLSAAHILAHYHRRLTGNLAVVHTPLEVSALTVDRRLAYWLLSASGNNVDIVSAARSIVPCEPRQLCAMVGKAQSKLGRLLAAHPYSDLLIYPSPAGKDGFLATNSLVAFGILLARAYGSLHGSATQPSVDAMSRELAKIVGHESEDVTRWRQASEKLWNRPTTLALYGPDSAIGAIDLESKFTEAAIGHVHIADFRNFAHGRHVWLAKRASESGVVAFITPSDAELADRTIGLLPDDVPVTRIILPANPIAAPLVALLAALHLTGWAGEARGIDPGDPGVPDFGRRLFHLAPSTDRYPLPRGVSRRAAAAIERKTNRSIQELEALGDLRFWLEAMRQFRTRVTEQIYGAIVLDYDGTVVDTRHRFEPPEPAMAMEITRLAKEGIGVGIATGRGSSVRRDLQKVIPETLWPRIVLGYYNGAEVASLDNKSAPSQAPEPSPALEPVAMALRAQPEMRLLAQLETRKHQLTLTPSGAIGADQIWTLVQSLLVGTQLSGVQVTRSGHSIDILDESTSKTRVVDHLRTASTQQVLTIGDRGRWPGNDYLLLAEPFGLSVDECSPQADVCWNLASAGQRGPTATLEYLQNLISIGSSVVKFAPGVFD